MHINSILDQYREIKTQYDSLTTEIAKLDKLTKHARNKKERNLLNTDKIRLQSSLEKVLSQYNDNLIIVPGDETRFEQIVGFPVEVVDLGYTNKGIILLEIRRYKELYKKGYQEYNSEYSFKFKNIHNFKCSPTALLLEKGVIGIINAQLAAQTERHYNEDYVSFVNVERIYYGLPVAKKSK